MEVHRTEDGDIDWDAVFKTNDHVLIAGYIALFLEERREKLMANCSQRIEQSP